jgi:HD superfamily phosphohydrolase
MHLQTAAGLLHDLGHGPFSHVYDGDFIGNMFPKYLKAHPHLKSHYENLPTVRDDYCHEQGSLMLIDSLLGHLGLQIDLDNLDKPLKQIGDGIDAQSVGVFDLSTSDDDLILTSRDMVFVKECIWGKPIPEIEAKCKVTGFVGRQAKEKEWLYDVVSNNRSGLDVDKVDYFARDERRAMNASGEIEKRVIEEAIVTWGTCTDPTKCYRCKHSGAGANGKHLMICYPEKMVTSAMDFFKKRYMLHKNVYKHHATSGAGFMISDILCLADPYFRISAPSSVSTGKAKLGCDSLPISRAMLEPSAFLQLKDSIIDVINSSTDPNLAEAKALIARWHRRDLYKCVAKKEINMNESVERRIWNKSTDEITQEILSVRGEHESDTGQKLVLQEEDFIVELCNIHHGSKDNNPLSKMRFLPKDKLWKLTVSIDSLPEACEINESNYDAQFPRAFQANSIRVFSRDSSKDDLLRHVFDNWLAEVTSEMEITLDYNEDEPHLCSPPVMLTQESDGDDDGDEDAHYGYSSFAHASTGRQSITPHKRYD